MHVITILKLIMMMVLVIAIKPDTTVMEPVWLIRIAMAFVMALKSWDVWRLWHVTMTN